MKALCVYCGSSDGDSPIYREAATRLGHEMARRGIALVTGGGRYGLMGVMADAVMEKGGE